MGVRLVLGRDCKRVLSNHSQAAYLFEDGDLAGGQAKGEGRRDYGHPRFPNWGNQIVDGDDAPLTAGDMGRKRGKDSV